MKKHMLRVVLATLLLAGCDEPPLVTKVETRYRQIPASFLDCGPAPLLQADPASAGDLGLFGYEAIAWGTGCAYRLGCVASLQAGQDVCKIEEMAAEAAADARTK